LEQHFFVTPNFFRDLENLVILEINFWKLLKMLLGGKVNKLQVGLVFNPELKKQTKDTI